MKRDIKNIIMLFATLSISFACSHDDVDLVIGMDSTLSSQEGYSITLVGAVADQTSKSIITDDGINMIYSWEPTDELYAIIATESGSYIKFNNDTQDYATVSVTPDEELSTIATLTFQDLTLSESIPAGSKLYICTKQQSSPAPTGVAIPYTFEFPIASGTEVLGNRHILAATLEIDQEVSLKDEEAIEGTLIFSHLTTTVRFGIQNQTDEDVEVDIFKVVAGEGLGICTNVTNTLGSYKYENPVTELINIGAESAITVKAGETNSYYVNFLLGEYSSVEENIFTITLNEDKKVFTSDILSSSHWAVEQLQAGNCYDIDYGIAPTLVFDLSSVSGDSLAEKLTTLGYNVDTEADSNDLNSFTKLTLSGIELTEDDLSLIAKMNYMEYLDLSGCTSSIDYAPAYWIRMTDSLISVILPESITRLYTSAFSYCPNLRYVNTSHLTTLAQYSFLDCPSMVTIDLSSATTIGNYAFQDCTALESVIFKSGTTIGTSSFVGCTALGELDLSMVGTIGTTAFEGCTNLTLSGDGDLTGIITEIGASAFLNCESITRIIMPEDVSDIDHIKANSFEGCTSLSQINIPSGVKQIYGSAFKGCTSLESIELPNSVTNLALSSFEGSGLTSITIPNNTSGSTITLGDYALAYCTSLKSITIESTTMLNVGTISTQYPLLGCTALESIKVPTDLVSTYRTTGAFLAYADIIESIDGVVVDQDSEDVVLDLTSSSTTLAEALAEYDLTMITSLTLSGIELSLTDLATISEMTIVQNVDISGCSAANNYIPAYWMDGKAALKSVSLPSAITRLYRDAFTNCVNLTSINSAHLTTLAQYALYNCSSLESIDLSSATTIGNYAFQGCSKLKSVVFNSGTTIGTSTFIDCTSLGELDMSMIGTIGTTSFSGCTNLTLAGDGDLTSLITEIGASAFLNCESITRIIMPEDVSVSNIDHIKANSFEGCTSLSQINIPSGVKQVYGSAFKGCTALTGIELPNTVTALSLSSFEGSGLTSITIPNNASGSTITLGDLALGNCLSLTSVVIESTTMITVGTDATKYPLMGSSALESIKVPADLVDTYKATAAFADYVNIISAIE